MSPNLFREHGQFLRELIDALPAAIYTTDAMGRLTHFNPACVQFSGRTPVIGSDRWCVTWRLYYPDGRPMPHDECPMAIALKEGRAVRGAEAIAERPDGTRIWFEPHPTPLRNQAGEIVGAVNMLVDITARKAAEGVRGHLAAIVESSDDAIVSKDLNGVIVSWNEGAQRIFGYTPEEAIGRHISILIPSDRLDEEPNIIARIRRGERVDHYETVRQRKDGTRIDISLTVSPVRDGSGRVVGASKIARDISQKKQAEATQTLLLNELNHRVKNTLASVRAIAQQTLRRTGDPEDFAERFSGRIQSLARAHSMLTEATWQGADLKSLIDDQLLSGAADETRLRAVGPAVRLDPQMTVHLALMLHELGTNSVKYGALSVPEGRVAVTWAVDDGQLSLKWVERGGPPVEKPSTRGFGTVLIEQSAAGAGGQAMMSPQREGMSWEISLPLPRPAPASGRRTQEPTKMQDRDIAKSQPLLKGMRFLVVEDEPIIALDHATRLESVGAEARIVGSEREALAALKESAFDAALLDANLHGRPVEAVAEALTNSAIPFVFVTGYGRDGLPAAYRQVPILPKPFSDEQMMKQLAQLAAAGKARSAC